MVDDSEEKYEGHDEGEYHFSDDMENFDEPELEAPKAAPAPKNIQENAAAVFSRYKRMIVSVSVFFGLIFLVYKMLSPTNAPPSTTDFAPSTAATRPVDSARPMASVTPKSPKPLVPAVQTSAAPGPEQSPVPQAQPQPTQEAQAQQSQVQQIQQTQAPSIPIPSPMEQIAQVPAAPTPSSAPVPTNVNPPKNEISAPASPPAAPIAQVAQPAMQPQQSMVVTTTAAPPTPSVSAAAQEETAEQNKMIMDKLASLEEENTKLVNMMQTQFAQKMSEVQSQDNESQEKIRSLNKRLANMEASMNKMAQILQDEGFSNKTPSALGSPGLPAAVPAQPKIGYVVQAIIPGRAWLKSDSGDTVTVAEGDILKDYGRVTKIDPYDGVVNIDTGNRVLVLSYGASND